MLWGAGLAIVEHDCSRQESYRISEVQEIGGGEA